MWNRRQHEASMVLALISVLLTVPCVRPATPMDPVDPFEQAKRLRRGVNILGYNSIWDDFSKARFQERHFKLIHDAGFQTVRINLPALQRLSAANGYRLEEAWLSTLDWAVKNALANQFMVILDLHNYEISRRIPMGTSLASWRTGSRSPRISRTPPTRFYLKC